MPRKWNLSLTYQPKIEAVKKGLCNQTIRKKGKTSKRVGDLVSFHGYVNGRGTPWTWRTPYWEITEVIDVYIGNWTFGYMTSGCGYHWNSPLIDEIARRDFIDPPKGEALREVMIKMNGKIPAQGIEAQIIRWSPCG